MPPKTSPGRPDSPEHLTRLIAAVLLGEAGLDPAAPIAADAEVGSAALPLGSMAYVQALIRVEDELGAVFADRLFTEVPAATLADVVRYARAALDAGNGDGAL
ncbi:MAG: hypothetical protein ACJ786_40405 [Catenulispora sp.]